MNLHTSTRMFCRNVPALLRTATSILYSLLQVSSKSGDTPIIHFAKYHRTVLTMFVSALRYAFFAIVCTMANSFVVVAPTTTIMTQQSLVTMYGYVPDGLTAEQWKKIKAKEAEKKANLGKVGPRYVHFSLSVVMWHLFILVG